VICDRAQTVDVLLANNFHFENNCAVLSESRRISPGLPRAAGTWLRSFDQPATPRLRPVRTIPRAHSLGNGCRARLDQGDRNRQPRRCAKLSIAMGIFDSLFRRLRGNSVTPEEARAQLFDAVAAGRASARRAVRGTRSDRAFELRGVDASPRGVSHS
jgi:hypothetical protein